MVYAVLTPIAETQRVSVRWLLRFFELFGDDSPNKDEVMIQVMLKKQVHEHYQKHMMSQSRAYVGLERFYDIWPKASPKTILRHPWLMRYLLRNRSFTATRKRH